MVPRALKASAEVRTEPVRLIETAKVVTADFNTECMMISFFEKSVSEKVKRSKEKVSEVEVGEAGIVFRAGAKRP